MRAAPAVAGTVALGLLLAACTLPGRSRAVEVAVTGTGFEPSSVTVVTGTQVRWVNRATAPQNVRSPDGSPPGEGEPLRSEDLQEGEVFTATLTEPGTWVVESTTPGDRVRTGSVVVVEEP